LNYSDVALSGDHNYVMSATFNRANKAYFTLEPIVEPLPNPGFGGMTELQTIDQSGQEVVLPKPFPDINHVTVTASPDNANFSVSYYDGLGAAEQEITIGVPNVSSDIIMTHQYDALRRKDRDWSPAPLAGNKGAYVDMPVLEQCYGTIYDDAPDNCHTAYFYANDPTERIIETRKPGDSWKQSTGVTVEYLTNEASGILSCYDLYYGRQGAAYFNITDRHPAGTLSVEKITDEDEHETYLFKNYNDSILLERKVVNGEYLDTYRVYDMLGNVRYILPPLASDMLDNISRPVVYETDELVSEYAYVYHYDRRNRLISKKFPGIDPVYFIYDKLNNLVLSQDGNQRMTNEYTYNVYDEANRIVLSGIVTDSYSLSDLRTHWNTRTSTTSFAGQTGAFYGYDSSSMAYTGYKDGI
ncbi:MAG: hypothetical protein K2M65_06035, partial [Muribaculaceae bacterium]|nr:hypothetical protein [Muribaculaceae bacterium]